MRPSWEQGPIVRTVRRWLTRGPAVKLPRGVGVAATVALVLASLVYGVVKGGHVPEIVAALKDARDQVANAAGFGIAAVEIAGRKQVSEHDIVAAAGVTGRSSLLFLDVEVARAGLKSHPWIADASVRKLYPDRLLVAVTEREPFALWQKQGKVQVIAADGTVLGPIPDKRFAALPLVVGPGAETRAKDFLATLDRFPSIRDVTRAGIFVAERRWNLKLKNGLDVRLPEADLDRALTILVALDRDKKLLSRDLTAVDLRLPDRVTVRLSETAAEQREKALKKPKRKGGDA